MTSATPLKILPQPDETTCGPTCLHTIYSFYGDEMDLQQLIFEVPQQEGGGTLGAWLANHALNRGYEATIYTYNLHVFDPSWFGHESFFIKHKLSLQAQYKNDPRLLRASEAYSAFLDSGGQLKYDILRPSLIRKFLKKGIPVLAGLSSTFLYDSQREYGPDCDYDDLRGEPSGHFVVLYGYDHAARTVSVADPLEGNPISQTQIYEMGIDRVINAILLGIVTYDANLIIITPKSKSRD